jgi:hypothetical protein
MGEVLVRRGLFEDGLVLMESSVEIHDDLGQGYGVWGTFPFLAEAKVHLGRYEEARADARQGAIHADKSKHRWGVGFSQFVEGLTVVAEGAHAEALALFQSAATIFEEVRHRENQGWVLGPLGLTAREAGDTALAQQSVEEALRIGVELGAFMPVMYGLPVAALLLADREALDRAVEVYACASRYKFVANSRWFEAMTGQRIRALAASLPAESVKVAQEQGQVKDWGVMAAELLDEM